MNNRTTSRYGKKQERKELFERQNGKCNICSGSLDYCEVTDHIIPLAIGGTNNMDNKQLLCLKCNIKKTSNDLKKVWAYRKEHNLLINIKKLPKNQTMKEIKKEVLK